jgi:hypothetical protein
MRLEKWYCVPKLRVLGDDPEFLHRDRLAGHERVPTVIPYYLCSVSEFVWCSVAVREVIYYMSTVMH